MIGQEARDGPSSLCTRPWGSEGPKKFDKIKIPHDIAWIMFHGLLYVVLGLLKSGGQNA